MIEDNSLLLAEKISQQLQSTGDFLTLSCQYEYAMPSFTFNVQSKNKIEMVQTSTRVSVIDTGIIMFEPSETVADKDIILSCAIHGNETAPIEICAKLVQQLILGELTVAQRVLFLFGNPPAINIGKRFVKENLNRLFSGAHGYTDKQMATDTLSESYRACLLENTVAAFFTHQQESGVERARYHYDLHTAIRASKQEKFAVYPYRHGKAWCKEQLAFLLACGVNTVLLSNTPTTSFSYFSSCRFSADAFTVELGKVRPFGENNMDNFSAITHTLTRLIAGEDVDVQPYKADDFNIYAVSQTINRTQQDFRLHFANDVLNFTDFPENSLLATDGDNEFRTQTMGEAIIFPNADVAIGQRALLTVIPTKIS